MNKKIFGIVFVLVGVLVLAGAGCGIKNLTGVQKQTNVNEPLKLSGRITDGECIEIMVDFRYASYLLTVKKDPFHSALISKKAYDKMDAFGKKYGVTRDGIAEACKAKINEPGFMEKVEKREQESGFITK